ncbi:MAG: ATP-binding cassette domain-containing protein, partial [Gammaproteobacteria bacterium]
MIDIEDLRFDYPGVRALDGVSSHLERGTITALVGPNGAGKTTLMRCVCGLERPLSGPITVDAVDVV